MERPGSELVNFETGQNPRQLFDVMAGMRLFRAGGHEFMIRGSILNLAGEEFAHNFGNPFSGTRTSGGSHLSGGMQYWAGSSQVLDAGVRYPSIASSEV
jgi:hypothetical protein